MYDALWMYHDFDVLHLDSEQPVRLDHLQSFVKQRRRIDSDFWTHIPSRVFERLLCRKIDKFVRRRFAKRSAGRRQNDSANFRRTTIETLKNRVVFAVHRQYMNAVFTGCPHHNLARNHTKFLARPGATFSALSPIEPVAPRTTTRLRFIFRQDEQN